MIGKPYDQDLWTERSLFGPPPKIGGLYKAIDITDCQCDDSTDFFAPLLTAENELPFDVGDVIMIVAWKAIVSAESDDNSTWGQWVNIDVLSHERVTRLVVHRQDWNKHFERMK